MLCNNMTNEWANKPTNKFIKGPNEVIKGPLVEHV